MSKMLDKINKNANALQVIIAFIILLGATVSSSVWIFRQVYEQPIVKDIEAIKQTQIMMLAKINAHLDQSARTLTALETNQKILKSFYLNNKNRLE